MEKEFIPYTEALALKELGFDESCFAIWSGIDELNFSITDTIRLYSSAFSINGTQSSKFYINDFNSLIVAAPTYSQAFRWFREKYGLFIAPNAISYENGPYLWFFEVNSTILSFGIDLGETDDFENYEEAELACLNKLIEIIEQKQI
jgi:hypothetical protein